MNTQSCDICINNIGITLKCGFAVCQKYLHIRCALSAGNIEQKSYRNKIVVLCNDHIKDGK